MEKIKLYIDFDGVILDTIKETYKLFLEEYRIDLKTISKEELENRPQISSVKKEIGCNFFIL